MGVFRVNGGFGGELQGADKGFFQLRQKMQGAAQKCHTPPDGLAAGKAGDGLIDHGLKMEAAKSAVVAPSLMRG